MSASVGAQKARGEVVYLGDPEGTQEDTEALLRVVLGDRVHSLVDCVGDCGHKLIGHHYWGTLSKPVRARLRGLGVRRKDSFNRCWKCIEKGFAPGKPKVALRRGTENRIPAEKLNRLPEIWSEVRAAGGGQPELGRALGCSRERARQLVKEHSLPRTHSLKEKAAVFLEELEHLAGLGMGVQYIATALGMTPDALVNKVDHLHQTGKTAVKFHGWHRRYDKEQAA